MSMSAEQSDLDIQALLRAEIRDLQFRHKVEIALLNARYALATGAPATGLPSLDQQAALLAQSPLFDGQWYLQTYPDVAEAAEDPAGHYLRSGAFEGRDPGPGFDSMAYYLANPDVAEGGWPALVHYLHSGESEGRSRVRRR